MNDWEGLNREQLVPWNNPGQGVMAEIERAVEALDGALEIADRAAG